MLLYDAGHIHWRRIGRWLVAVTPVHGPRVYRIPTRTELDCPAWNPDAALWGGKPEEIMADYVGKDWKGTPLDGHLAGLGTEEDTWPATWEPTADGQSLPPAMQFFRPGGLTETTDRISTTSKRRIQLSFTDLEVKMHYRETKGRPTIICGWCGKKKESRNLQKLLTWFRKHECFEMHGGAE
jgi:hypothetical protein